MTHCCFLKGDETNLLQYGQTPSSTHLVQSIFKATFLFFYWIEIVVKKKINFFYFLIFIKSSHKKREKKLFKNPFFEMMSCGDDKELLRYGF